MSHKLFRRFHAFGTAWLVAILCSLLIATAFSAQPQVLFGHVPVAAKQLIPVGRLDKSKRLSLAIGLPLRNRAELADFLKEISDPASANYRKYLTPAQFTERFGPTENDYQSVIQFAKAHGLTVTARHPNRAVLDVEAAASEVEKAFHCTLRTYRHPTESREFYAPDREPSLDLATSVLNISGLENYALAQPSLKPIPAGQHANVATEAGSGPNGRYGGGDFRAAYVPDTSLTGSGQSVGLLAFDGYYASDIAAYATLFHVPNVPLVNVPVDGGISTPGSGDREVSLDIELAMTMAPGLSTIYVYEAPKGGGEGGYVDVLSKMATDNLAKQLSSSWFISGGAANPAAEQIFQQMAAQGQSFFKGAGDSDAYTGLIDFPCDSPNITVVGGVELATSGPGGSWVSDTAWNTGGGTGGGGGISTQYAIPYWQQGIDMSANQGSTTMRNIPDVALVAHYIWVTYGNGSSVGVAGCSCAGPLWAGFTALVNQQAVATTGTTVGFLNPALYALGKSSGYAAYFHDTVTGGNTSPSSPTKFFAVPGYDLCTGLGTPAGTALINALANPSVFRTPAAQIMQFGNDVQLSIPSLAGYSYQLQRAGSLSAPVNWQNIGAAKPGTNGVLMLVDSGGVLLNSAFYRVQISQ